MLRPLKIEASFNLPLDQFTDNGRLGTFLGSGPALERFAVLAGKANS